MDDESAMIAVRDHDDTRIFSELMSRWQQRVCLYCFHVTRSWEVSEDISQDVFLRVYENRTKYSPSAAFSTFIWKITTNLCSDFFRKQKTEKKASTKFGYPEPGSVDPARQCEIREEQTLVAQALNSLTPKQREVLVLKHYQQLKIREIAAVLELPIGTVASRLADALDRLAAEVKKRQGNQ